MQGNPLAGNGADPASVERAAKLVASLGQGLESADDVFATFAELDALPPEVVRDALVALTGESATLDDLDDATRMALGMQPRPVVLRPIAIVRDADVLELGRTADAQVRIAGETWDGVAREAHERLDGEDEGSFAGTLERMVLAAVPHDGSIPDVTRPLYDVLLFQRDAGAIFESGTTKRIGAIAYGTVEMADRRARIAVQSALAWSQANRPAATPFYLPGAEPKPEPVEEAPETVAAPPSTPTFDEAISSAAPTVRVEVPKRRFVQESFPWAGGEEPAAAKKASKKAAGKKAAAEAAPKKKKKAAGKKAAAEAAPKKAAGKKAAAETVPEKKKKAAGKAAAEAAPKKAAPKKAAGKKAAAEAAPKKAAGKKAVGKKAAAEAAPKKAAGKKAAVGAATKKAAAKKAAAPKKAAGKKAATEGAPKKKTAAKKATAAPKKKAAAKKTAAAKKKR